MTLTVKLAPETQALLEAEAARRGVSLGQLATEMLDKALQNIEDFAEARRILADTSEPTIPREQLRAVLSN